jgi:hypothetical protein
MREITQSNGVTYRMAPRLLGDEHRGRGGDPMQILRATAVAIPFVVLAGLVALLSANL